MGAYSDEESGFMFGAEREGIDSFQNMCNHYGVEEDWRWKISNKRIEELGREK